MPGLLSINERIPLDIDWRKASGVRSREESLTDMISLTVKNLADKARETVDVFLNNHSISEIARAIHQYGHKEEDIIPIINLIVDHAQDLIQKYNQDGKDLNFTELLDLKKKFPDKSVALLVTYALAKRNPKLTGLAGSILAEEQPVSNTDAYVRFSPVKSQIRYVNAADFAAQIYTDTNDKQEKRLANLAVETHSRAAQEALAWEKIKTTLIIKT